MLKARNVGIKFWAEALNIACYTLNRIYLRPGTSKTPYEIWRGKKPNLKYFQEFGSTCFILNDREQRSKFDAKSDEGMFLGYSLNRCVYRVYNKMTKSIMESVNVAIDDEKGIPSVVGKDDLVASFTNVTTGDVPFGNIIGSEDDAPSGNSTGLEDDAPSNGTAQNQEEIEAKQSADIKTLKPSKQVQKNILLQILLEILKLAYELEELPKSTIGR